jgi:hypothetical protein
MELDMTLFEHLSACRHNYMLCAELRCICLYHNRVGIRLNRFDDLSEHNFVWTYLSVQMIGNTRQTSALIIRIMKHFTEINQHPLFSHVQNCAALLSQLAQFKVYV